MISNKKPTKTFLRWAGSKKQLLPILSNYWSKNHTRYVEPFAGSACLFFHIQPNSAILGDINSELICTFLEIKDNFDDIVAELDKLNRHGANKEFYYELRSINPNILSSSRRAARFVYLNRYCFNGLYRTNLKGLFNVPYGGGRSGKLPSRDSLSNCAKVLQKSDLLNCDFEETLLKAKRGDFVYIDPPYFIKSKRSFNEYNKRPFNASDMTRLRECIDRLTQEGIEFLLSYADSPEAQLLTQGYHFEHVQVKRNIAGFTGKRRAAQEILVTNRHIVNSEPPSYRITS